MLSHRTVQSSFFKKFKKKFPKIQLVLIKQTIELINKTSFREGFNTQFLKSFGHYKTLYNPLENRTVNLIDNSGTFWIILHIFGINLGCFVLDIFGLILSISDLFWTFWIDFGWFWAFFNLSWPILVIFFTISIRSIRINESGAP